MMLFIYALLIFGATLAGGSLPLLVHASKTERLKLFVVLGAGILIGMAFLHLVPHAAELSPHAFGPAFLGGFVLLLILERFLMVHACEEQECHYHRIGIAAVMGLILHGLIEGFALGSSQLITPLGPLVLVAILMHKGPSAFALSSILKLASKDNRQILLYTLSVALSGPLGILTAYLAIGKDSVANTAGIFLGLTSGTFVYIGTCDLLPEIHRGGEKGKTQRLILFLVGVILSLISGYFLEGGMH